MGVAITGRGLQLVAGVDYDPKSLRFSAEGCTWLTGGRDWSLRHNPSRVWVWFVSPPHQTFFPSSIAPRPRAARVSRPTMRCGCSSGGFEPPECPTTISIATVFVHRPPQTSESRASSYRRSASSGSLGSTNHEALRPAEDGGDEEPLRCGYGSVLSHEVDHFLKPSLVHELGEDLPVLVYELGRKEHELTPSERARAGDPS